MKALSDNKDASTIITINGEDGRPIDCEIMLTFDYGGRDIIALLPIDADADGNAGGTSDGEPEPGVLLFGYAATELEDGDISMQLTEIPDREFDGVLGKFAEIVEV